MTGLAFAFLLVLLGSIISRSGRDDNVPAPESSTTNSPKEPLAELGVAPGSDKPDKAAENQDSGDQ